MIGSLRDPRNTGNGRVPGFVFGGTNYVANAGSGVVDYRSLRSADCSFSARPWGFEIFWMSLHTR